LGKGDSLFRGVHSVTADWYVFLDADLGNISLAHIDALVAPIGRDGVQFVKGGFVRVDEHGVPRAVPGGRVTEEVGRPLLHTVAAELAEFSQPLSGQVAIRADLAKSLSFVTGYGVEIAMLIDVYRAVGLQGIMEADMGAVNNRWKPDDALGDVMREVTAGAAMRGVDVGCVEPMTLPVLKDRSLSN
jgi:glucosyl-3-phosphoglycerate synthase